MLQIRDPGSAQIYHQNRIAKMALQFEGRFFCCFFRTLCMLFLDFQILTSSGPDSREVGGAPPRQCAVI